MAIRVRPTGCAADYAAWRQVRLAVVPGEPTPSLEELQAHAGPRERYVLAELDGALAGSGLVARADLAGAAMIAPRVLPGCRRRAWAARTGVSEVSTWTQVGNHGMLALNTGLGYTTRSQTITMHASLPLPAWPARRKRPHPDDQALR